VPQRAVPRRSSCKLWRTSSPATARDARRRTSGNAAARRSSSLHRRRRKRELLWRESAGRAAALRTSRPICTLARRTRGPRAAGGVKPTGAGRCARVPDPLSTQVDYETSVVGKALIESDPDLKRRDVSRWANSRASSSCSDAAVPARAGCLLCTS
jgi:hypothetical protein